MRIRNAISGDIIMINVETQSTVCPVLFVCECASLLVCGLPVGLAMHVCLCAHLRKCCQAAAQTHTRRLDCCAVAFRFN